MSFYLTAQHTTAIVRIVMKLQSTHTSGRKGSVADYLAKLNDIQRDWMALDPAASQAECDRVFRLMEEMPKNYASFDRETGEAVAVLGGSPMNAPMPLAAVLEHYGSRIDRHVAYLLSLDR